MRMRWVVESFVVLLILLANSSPVSAGDSFYGRVAKVRSGDVVSFEYSARKQYDVRLVGIEVPNKRPFPNKAKQRLTELAQGKNVRIYIDHREKKGELVARVFVDDPNPARIRDIGLELLKEGVVVRQSKYDQKYPELARAESQAQNPPRGIWLLQHR